MSSGVEARSMARNGYHGSRSFTYAVTSTPLTTSFSTSASMSTLTTHAWLILASVRLTSRNRAPVRSAPQNTAPARSPSNSSGMWNSLPVVSASPTAPGPRRTIGDLRTGWPGARCAALRRRRRCRWCGRLRRSSPPRSSPTQAGLVLPMLRSSRASRQPKGRVSSPRRRASTTGSSTTTRTSRPPSVSPRQ